MNQFVTVAVAKRGVLPEGEDKLDREVTFYVPCRTPVLANTELELAYRTYRRNWDGCAE